MEKENLKIVKAVAGIIINRNNEILVTQRDKGKCEEASLKWEFAGGKIEKGETPQQALARELQEELEINVTVGKKFFQVEHSYSTFHLSMPVYLCYIKNTNVKLNVHLNYKWLKPNEILSVDYAPADIPVAQKIFNELKI